MSKLKRKQVKELLSYASQDPDKWKSHVDSNKIINIKYEFGKNSFTFDGAAVWFTQPGYDGRMTITKLPITLFPYNTKMVDNQPGPYAISLLLYSLIVYWLLAPISYGLVALGIHYGLDLRIGGGIVLVYNFLMAPALLFLISGVVQIWKWKWNRILKKLIKIRNEHKKIILEERERKDNELFYSLVEEHFKKQSRKAKLEQLDK